MINSAGNAISNRLENGEQPSLRAATHDARRALGDALVFTLALLIIFLLWARAATMVHIFFPAGQDAPIEDLILFLTVGSAVGAIFCALIFLGSAFSLPMMLDRHTDAVTAIITSVNAVLRNKLPLFVWACCIGACLFVGLATFYLGLSVLLPVLGYATWHAYRETVDASDWPKRAFRPADGD